LKKGALKTPNMAFKPYLVVNMVGLAKNYDDEDRYALGWKGIGKCRGFRHREKRIVNGLVGYVSRALRGVGYEPASAHRLTGRLPARRAYSSKRGEARASFSSLRDAGFLPSNTKFLHTAAKRTGMHPQG
jgi:hypothetical protein